MTRRKPPDSNARRNVPTSRPAKRQSPAVEPKPRAVAAEPLGVAAAIPLYSRLPGTAPLGLEHTEWVLTNSLGGFAMGTALGLPTRRYHAMLITDSPDSAQRRATLNAIVERLVIRMPGGADEVHDLSCFRFEGEDPAGVIHPTGHTRLVRFEKDVTCRWVYQAGPVQVTKELLLPKSTRSAIVRYQVKARRSAVADVRLELMPLVSMRDYHVLRRVASSVSPSAVIIPGTAPTLRVQAGDGALTIIASRGELDTSFDGAGWWRQFLYRIDRERGQDHIEDLYCPGRFTAELSARSKPDSLTLRFGVDERELSQIEAFENELNRVRRHAEDAIEASFAAAACINEGSASTIAALALAADDFVVHPRIVPTDDTLRGVKPTTILAGYPWFTDWGRDTMISLPGLLLESGRFADALAAMRRFAVARRRGIIPNRFTDVGTIHATDLGATGAGEPEYNTIDASLWFIIAASRYLERSRDVAGFAQHLLPSCIDIVQAYRHGTDFGIAMDPADFLIAGGSPSTQLTWMDAKRDGVCFTPRHGKAVEINALWHSALLLLAEALILVPEPMVSRSIRSNAGEDEIAVETHPATLSANFRSLADAVAQSFRRVFYSESMGCCVDVVAPDGAGHWRASTEVRPNQVFAVSLPHSPLTTEQQRRVLSVIRDRLLTPLGLRTLAPGSAGYAPRFRGPIAALDAAYHNGTVWPWLLGPFAEGLARADQFSAASISEARSVLAPLVRKLDAECVGSIAEVFDAEGTSDGPQRAGGCPAQAWSVAEVRRVTMLLSRHVGG